MKGFALACLALSPWIAFVAVVLWKIRQVLS